MRLSKMEKRKRTKTALLHILQVYDNNHQQVGNGWIVWHEGRTYRPILCDFDGLPLEEGWFNLLTTESHLIVVNRSIH